MQTYIYIKQNYTKFLRNALYKTIYFACTFNNINKHDSSRDRYIFCRLAYNSPSKQFTKSPCHSCFLHSTSHDTPCDKHVIVSRTPLRSTFPWNDGPGSGHPTTTEKIQQFHCKIFSLLCVTHWLNCWFHFQTFTSPMNIKPKCFLIKSTKLIRVFSNCQCIWDHDVSSVSTYLY